MITNVVPFIPLSMTDAVNLHIARDALLEILSAQTLAQAAEIASRALADIDGKADA